MKNKADERIRPQLSAIVFFELFVLETTGSLLFVVVVFCHCPSGLLHVLLQCRNEKIIPGHIALLCAGRSVGVATHSLALGFTSQLRRKEDTMYP